MTRKRTDDDEQTATDSRNRAPSADSGPRAPRRLLTIRQAAEYVGWPEGRVRRYVGARRIPFVKFERSIYLEQQALDAWIEQHRLDATAAESRRAPGLNPELAKHMPKDRVF